MTGKIETVDLQYPFEANGVKVINLTMRRPTVGDFLNSSQGGRSDRESNIHLLADVCGISPDDVKKMDLSDYFELSNRLLKMQGLAKDNSVESL